MRLASGRFAPFVTAAFAWLLTAASAVALADVQRVDIQAIEASLREGRPRATLARYFDCARHRGTAYAAIATGAREWVALAERMLAYSDACYTEGLQDALGKAMQKAPRNVLPLVGKTATLAAESICLPFISDEIPPAAQRAAVTRSRRAIQGVRDKALTTQRQACLQFIAAVEANLAPPAPPVPAAPPASANPGANPGAAPAGRS